MGMLVAMAEWGMRDEKHKNYGFVISTTICCIIAADDL